MNYLYSYTVQYIIDINMYPCDNLKGKLLLYLHHLIDIYVYFGGFLFNPVIHLIVVVITAVHWITNDDKCIFTELTNKVVVILNIQDIKVLMIFKDIGYKIIIQIYRIII